MGKPYDKPCAACGKNLPTQEAMVVSEGRLFDLCRLCFQGYSQNTFEAGIKKKPHV